MVRNTSATTIAGRNSGSITRETSCQRVAPSTRAASSVSMGRASTAANRIRNTNGTQCQTSTTITDHSASDVEPSQFAGGSPIAVSAWLKIPKS